MTAAHPVPQNVLRAKMAAKGLRLKKLAQLTGMPRTTVSQILGGHFVDPARLKKIAERIENYPGPKITVHI